MTSTLFIKCIPQHSVPTRVEAYFFHATIQIWKKKKDKNPGSYSYQCWGPWHFGADPDPRIHASD